MRVILLARSTPAMFTLLARGRESQGFAFALERERAAEALRPLRRAASSTPIEGTAGWAHP